MRSSYAVTAPAVRGQCPLLGRTICPTAIGREEDVRQGWRKEQICRAWEWPQLGLINPDGDVTDAEAIAAIIPITGATFACSTAFAPKSSASSINELQMVTKEVVETARETLVIGPGL